MCFVLHPGRAGRAASPAGGKAARQGGQARGRRERFRGDVPPLHKESGAYLVVIDLSQLIVILIVELISNDRHRLITIVFVDLR